MFWNIKSFQKSSERSNCEGTRLALKAGELKVGGPALPGRWVPGSFSAAHTWETHEMTETKASIRGGRAGQRRLGRKSLAVTRSERISWPLWDLTDCQMPESWGTVGGRNHRTENSGRKRHDANAAAWNGGLPAFGRSVPINRGQRKEDIDSPGHTGIVSACTTHVHTLYTHLSKPYPHTIYQAPHTNTIYSTRNTYYIPQTPRISIMQTPL